MTWALRGQRVSNGYFDAIQIQYDGLRNHSCAIDYSDEVCCKSWDRTSALIVNVGNRGTEAMKQTLVKVLMIDQPPDGPDCPNQQGGCSHNQETSGPIRLPGEFQRKDETRSTRNSQPAAPRGKDVLDPPREAFDVRLDYRS